ncbi:MAG: class I SAM-dependent methyltransferase [Rubrivivax sp.]
MRHPEQWKPSKYVLRGGSLRASRDREQVGIGSRLVADAVAALYARHLPAVARGRLVDLGCGQVPLYATYRPHVQSVTCVDWPGSPHAGTHVDQLADLGERLPFDDASFDTVLLSDVLEHVPQPQRLCGEIARLLAPQGRLVANVPFLYGLHELPHDYFRFTEFALRYLARETGLRVDLLAPVGGSAEVFADFCAKHLARLPIAGAPMAAALQAVVTAFGRTLAGQTAMRRSAARFPLGYFLIATKAEAIA